MRHSQDRSAWLAKAGYGLGLHWTAQSLPRGKRAPMPFARAVERFDVSRLAAQCDEAGAGWLLFTISHALQYLPFPSARMDAALPGRTCERDLMGELAAALARRGIRLIFYYPSTATREDPDWQKACGLHTDPAAYQALQFELVAEIGERYGKALAGWWIDNCADPRFQPQPAKPVDADYYPRYAEALRRGNPKRLVAFNFTGTGPGLWRSTLGKGIADYAAGESDSLDRIPCGPRSGEGGTRWHAYVWMDDDRGGPEPGWIHTVPGKVGPPRYRTEHVIAYMNCVLQQRGAFTYGVAPYQDDLIAETTMTQLRALKKAFRA